ncbi:MAG TPA: sigma-70 family RNA polymerase sigma factor [Spirochaetota bacterium]|nr:sigma-70 family RNA polymerase sigma factor [Spirochaetota bacterium]HNT09420.1 sigma-70 family RNA polymerase sigma factor [Spirochaetota bacterium]HNV48025.1 sigma-70 family RNA polymerase sigma factor [Spirochaetota bacterium]HOS42046.1 sigma-70 family RNA polymerase sigma factor [Spirochaetota bacterium]HPI21712.1 sigma-70 family RNA polymerase sigma factor [Spirochaetota bacterium]
MNEYTATIAACYARHSNAVLDFLSRFLRDRHAAEDLTQETFIRLLNRKEALDPDHPTALSYLLTIARHIACDHLRHQGVERRYQTMLQMEEVTLNERFFNDVADAHLEGEVISTMHDAIDSMPPRARSLILGKFYQRKKNNRLMRELGISNFILQRTLREAMTALRELLRAHYRPSEPSSN